MERPGTVAGFVQSQPNDTLMQFAQVERARGARDRYRLRRRWQCASARIRERVHRPCHLLLHLGILPQGRKQTDPNAVGLSFNAVHVRLDPGAHDFLKTVSARATLVRNISHRSSLAFRTSVLQ